MTNLFGPGPDKTSSLLVHSVLTSNRRCDLRSSAPSSAAGRFDVQDVSLGEPETAFPGQLRCCFAAGADEPCAAGCPFFSAGKSVGLQFSAIGEKRYLRISKKVDLPDQSVASTRLARAPGAVTIGVATHTQRIGVFQRLDGSVQGIRHVRLHAGDSIQAGMMGISSYWRSVYTLDVWHEGGVKRIILSGDPQTTASMRDWLIAQGIPRDAVTIEGRSRSTRENALFTAALVRDIPGPYLLLTSDIHMWRAQRAFRKAGLEVFARPAPDAFKRGTDWRDRWRVFLDIASEGVKIGYYKWKQWI